VWPTTTDEQTVLEPDPVITCVDCGGRAHLITPRRGDPEDPEGEEWQPGDVATYRCADCLDRWDVVLDDDA
jgi:hypothetical protein